MSPSSQADSLPPEPPGKSPGLPRLVIKNLPSNDGDLRTTGSIPGLGRLPGEGNSYLLQYSGLKNSMDCIVHQFSSVQSLSSVQLFEIPWTVACQASLSIINSQFMSIESVMPSNHLILCHPLLLLPSMFPSIRVFSNESALCTRWPKYWSFSFNISPPKEYSGLISFRMDWLDLFAVQGTRESSPALQFESISSSGLSLFYSPTLASIRDYWKNHSFQLASPEVASLQLTRVPK